MSPVREAAERLTAALKTVPNLPVSSDPSKVVSPPAVVVSVPRLTFEAVCSEPTSLTFTVFLVVPLDAMTVDRLWDLISPVTQAIEDHADAVVTTADPGVYLAGTAELPCYALTVEMTTL